MGWIATEVRIPYRPGLEGTWQETWRDDNFMLPPCIGSNMAFNKTTHPVLEMLSFFMPTRGALIAR